MTCAASIARLSDRTRCASVAIPRLPSTLPSALNRGAAMPRMPGRNSPTVTLCPASRMLRSATRNASQSAPSPAPGDGGAMPSEQCAQLMRRQMRQDRLRGGAGEQRPPLPAAEQTRGCARRRHIVDAHDRAAEQHAQAARCARCPAPAGASADRPRGSPGRESRMVRSSSMTRGPSIQAPPATGVSSPASCNSLDIAVAGRARRAGEPDQLLGGPGRRGCREHVQQRKHFFEAARTAL